jgi:hemolysin III
MDDQEWINGLTHALGLLLSLLGSVLLLRHAYEGAVTWYLLSCVVYCAALVAVYTASTLSHWISSPVWKRRFRIWDQGLIFLLIVATFTPLTVAYFNGWWHLLTACMWVMGLVAFMSKIVYAHRVDRIAVWSYLSLGWFPMLGFPELCRAAPLGVATLFLVGGLSYTCGAALLMNDHRARYLHAGWHLFVIAGSACHYLAVYKFVTPI